MEFVEAAEYRALAGAYDPIRDLHGRWSWRGPTGPRRPREVRPRRAPRAPGPGPTGRSRPRSTRDAGGAAAAGAGAAADAGGATEAASDAGAASAADAAAAPSIARGPTGRDVPIESLDALVDYFIAAGKRGVTVNRYKGLGEMNPEQLWATTMNPDDRTLLVVRAEDDTEADLMFTTLMGDQVEPRRKFIEDNALDVQNLDV